ncbi:MAG: putative ABC transporter permease [Acetatifactor sp.]|nr:putative ABC transporter permease [Acetatifactor sp.]
MYSYSIYQWLFFFYLYCFFGWCVESTYVSIKDRKLTNRGFIRGPFLPLYGSGGMMMLIVSMPFRDNVFLVYIAGCLGATVLEYVTGVTMEALFKVRYWDYSKNKFNFQGHICLGTSLSWGFLTIFMTEIFHVPVERIVLAIPEQVLNPVTVVLTVLIGADFALSFKAAIDLKDLLAKMESTKGELISIQKRLDAIITSAGESLGSKKEAIAVSMDELKMGIEVKFESLKNLALTKPSEYMESVKEELTELVKKYTVNIEIRSHLSSIRDFFQKDMIRSNPSMTSDKYQESLDEVKQQTFKKKK